MKAIVIGSTGVVGREIVNQLIDDSSFDKIISITRREVKYSSDKVDNVVVNFDDLESYKDAFRADVLFSALGTTLKTAGSIEAQRVVDLDYQYKAAQIASEQGIKQFCLVSSSGANSSSRSAYLKMKGELEDKVKNLNFESILFIQPSLLLGERNDFRLGEKVGALVMPLLCKLPGLRRYKPIKGSQVARAMIHFSKLTEERVETYSLEELFYEVR